MKSWSWLWCACLGLGSPLVDACDLRVAQLERPAASGAATTSDEGGFERDLLKELAQRSGCRVGLRWVSLRGAWMALDKGEVDVLPGVLITSERERQVLMVPLVAVTTVLLVPELPGHALTPERLLALPEARVLRLRGGAYAPAVRDWLDALSAQGRVDEVGDYKAGLRLLRAGRAQGFPMSAALLPKQAGAALSGLHVVEAWPNELIWAGMALSLSTLDETQRLRVQKALASMLRDGTMRRLVRQHYGELALQKMRLAPADGLAPATAR
jgi:ABC-type amino acid transport substrate-binding protein